MRNLQKVSAFFIFQLYFIDDYKNKYIILLHNYPAFQHIFPSILPTSSCHHNSKPLVLHAATDAPDSLCPCQGRAIAQAVSRWLPTAEARVWSCRIWGGQSTSVSPANLHSTNYSTITIIYHLGLVQ
jgi:hypothetical protein